MHQYRIIDKHSLRFNKLIVADVIDFKYGGKVILFKNKIINKAKKFENEQAPIHETQIIRNLT